MKLKTLHIEEISSWDEDTKGKGYEGLATFRGATGEVKLKLSKEQIDAIFMIAANSIIATAKEAANAMTLEIIEHKQAVALITSTEVTV